MMNNERPKNKSDKKRLSDEGLNFVISVASAAMEGIDYTRDVIEKLIIERGLTKEASKILSRLEEEGVIEPLKKRNG